MSAEVKIITGQNVTINQTGNLVHTLPKHQLSYLEHLYGFCQVYKHRKTSLLTRLSLLLLIFSCAYPFFFFVFLSFILLSLRFSCDFIYAFLMTVHDCGPDVLAQSFCSCTAGSGLYDYQLSLLYQTAHYSQCGDVVPRSFHALRWNKDGINLKHYYLYYINATFLRWIVKTFQSEMVARLSDVATPGAMASLIKKG